MRLVDTWLFLVAAGAALVAFSVVNLFLLYAAGVPKTNLNISAPLVGTVKVSGFPDPYVVGVYVVRGVLLLAIGLVGAKLLEIGLAERREKAKERQRQQYYEQYGYYYQQY
ncbi:MAG: hypothetical protein ABWK05_08510 [Pyrobaculum sp.]